MFLLFILWMWLGLKGVSQAKPPPPLTCPTWTDKAIVFIENGVANCTDGPLYLEGTPSAITLDNISIVATPSGLTYSDLTGTGNVQACIDPKGKLYRGNPGC